MTTTSSRPADGSMQRSEAAWKNTMLTKLFSMYPLARHQNPEATLRIYEQELRDIPGLILSHALARITKKPGSFLPTVGAIRGEAVAYMRSRGLINHNPRAEGDEHVNIERAVAKLPEGLRTRIGLLVEGKKA